MFTRCASLPLPFQTRRMFAGGTPPLLYLTPGFGGFLKMHPKAGVAPESLWQRSLCGNGVSVPPEFLDSHTRIR